MDSSFISFVNCEVRFFAVMFKKMLIDCTSFWGEVVLATSNHFLHFNIHFTH
jgi:hypothetical protein